ncbi:MAG: cation:proton antiporter regulatory subunit [Gaiellales bacterium]|jgi:TrkA domain protein
MAAISETPLPGIGVRLEFTTQGGQALGVVVRRDGDRDLLVYSREDPDACKLTLHLEPEDVSALVDALGGSAVVARQQESLRQSLEGIDLEWVQIPEGGAAAGHTIAESALRRSTGASIVSVIRGEQVVTSPASDLRIEAGDTLVVVGSAAALAQARSVLADA